MGAAPPSDAEAMLKCFPSWATSSPDSSPRTMQYANVCIDGDPLRVKPGLDEIADMYGTNDLSIVTICHDYADRRSRYELVAEVCGYLGDELRLLLAYQSLFPQPRQWK